MRKGAGSTSRAIAEQATATEQISKEADRLSRVVVDISKAMNEQATNSSQIVAASEHLRQQSEQAAKALSQQSTAVRDVNSATQNVTKQMKLINESNRAHTRAGREVLGHIESLRAVVSQNSNDMKLLDASNVRARASAGETTRRASRPVPEKTTSDSGATKRSKPGRAG
jgi:methyl-accepting chemotaxis protein